MNYAEIYNQLCIRGQLKRNLVFKEKHHIIPQSLGGTSNQENLTDLTPEEHFVAHQLLLKLYPKHRGLAHAAHMMTVGANNQGRSKNKCYGWLKRRFISECRSRSAEKNPSFGTMWISNIEQKISKKIKKTEVIPEGWVSGRNKWKVKSIICKECGVTFQQKKQEVLCSEKCRGYELIDFPLSSSGRAFITDGNVTKRSCIIPDGWRKGRSAGSRGELLPPHT